MATVINLNFREQQRGDLIFRGPKPDQPVAVVYQSAPFQLGPGEIWLVRETPLLAAIMTGQPLRKG